MNLKTKCIHFLKLVFPHNFIEWGIFLFFLISYGIFGTIIAMDYRIVFDDRIPWDAYFSFDNRSIVMTGGGFERHPLSNYFFDWYRNLAFYISDGKKDEVFRLVYAWGSNIAISLSLVQIYKYLKNIIGLPVLVGLLLILMTSFFSTSILLSFTPENYTYTFLLLCIFNYYAALKIRNGQEIPVAALTIAGVGVGGLTITNILKIYIPLIFSKNLFWNWKKLGLLVLKGVVSAGIFVLLFLNRLNFDYHRIFTKTGEQYEKFSQPKVTPLWDMIASWFVGGNVLFPSFVIRDYHNKQNFQYKALFMDVYSSYFSYAFVFLLIAMLLWAYLKNFKNSWVQILMLSFLVDIIIHAVLKFGLHTSYIYGGHFVFVYPLLWGWLLQSYSDKKMVYQSILAVTVLMFCYLMLNNGYRIAEFFDFLERYYR